MNPRQKRKLELALYRTWSYARGRYVFPKQRKAWGSLRRPRPGSRGKIKKARPVINTYKDFLKYYPWQNKKK